MFEILSPCCRWTSFTPAGVGVFFGHGCFLLLGVASAENDRKNDAEFAKDWWFERRGCTVEESDAVETRDAVETHAESKTLNISTSLQSARGTRINSGSVYTKTKERIRNIVLLLNQHITTVAFCVNNVTGKHTYVLPYLRQL